MAPCCGWAAGAAAAATAACCWSARAEQVPSVPNSMSLSRSYFFFSLVPLPLCFDPVRTKKVTPANPTLHPTLGCNSHRFQWMNSSERQINGLRYCTSRSFWKFCEGEVFFFSPYLPFSRSLCHSLYVWSVSLFLIRTLIWKKRKRMKEKSVLIRCITNKFPK